MNGVLRFLPHETSSFVRAALLLSGTREELDGHADQRVTVAGMSVGGMES
jgi:hypothetical protein